VRQGAGALDLLLAALALAFLWELLRSLRENAPPGPVVLCLLDADEDTAIEVCVADALRALEAAGPYLGAVVVAARPARSAILAALSRRHNGVVVAVAGDGGLSWPGRVLTAAMGPGFRAAALAGRIRALASSSTTASASPKRE
jgi:hypothetical protein